MKCPKCQYFSFDSGARCRNCGYDFSLVPDAPDPDLAIQDGTEAIGPLADFTLNDLFTPGGRDPDAPLVTADAAPRAPVAVRRTAPVAAKPKARRETGRVDREPRLALDTEEIAIVPDAVPDPWHGPLPSIDAPATDSVHASAPVGARALGGLIDLLLVAAIDALVVYFTLKICDLPFAEVLTLPLAPLVSFLLLLNGGYLATFVAASGQTIGKMAAGTRVVPADPAATASDRVSFGQAIVRAAGYLVSALPAGAGFLPALFGHERRALHDRLADTRVVKA
ncbi:MAG: RDD family protein [Vicinamibacterales bacterium]